MALPRVFLDELQARSDIVEVIGSYVSLKRHGRVYKAICPFHSEKTASFTVYPNTQSFFCFGCNVGGGAVNFVMRQDNLEYIEAVRLLAQRAGMEMPDRLSDEESRIRRRALEANRKAARFFFETLNSEAGKEARAYLRRRGLSDSIIRRFGIGYSAAEWSALRDYLRSFGFHEDELLAAGLLVKGKKGSYDMFRGRVMFPIIDLRGNVIAFGGRALGEGPKYINTPDTVVFKKSRNLFALHIAKNDTGRTIVLTEGYMDVAALHQNGFSNAVATLGTAFTGEHARVLSKYADEVVISYDTDDAGQKATGRAIDLLREVGLEVRVVGFEGAKDPDEYIRKFGAERFRMILSGSSNSIEYELARSKMKYPVSTDEGRVRYLAEAVEILARCRSITERDVYAGRLAEELRVDKASIVEQASGISGRRAMKTRRDADRKLVDLPSQFNVMPSQRGKLGAAAAEQRLLALLFRNPDLLKTVNDRLKDEDFFSDDALKIYKALRAAVEADDFNGFDSLTEALSAQQMSMLAQYVTKNTGVNFSENDLVYFVDKMKESMGKPDSEHLKNMDVGDIVQMIRQTKGSNR